VSIALSAVRIFVKLVAEQHQRLVALVLALALMPLLLAVVFPATPQWVEKIESAADD
jgi:hypothetical protein